MKEEQVLLFSLRSKTFPVKSNFRYLHDNMTCRACHNNDTIENEEHICGACPVFESEQNFKILNINDVYGPLDNQIIFVRQFKFVARKWKLLLEIENQPLRWTLPAP